MGFAQHNMGNHLLASSKASLIGTSWRQYGRRTLGLLNCSMLDPSFLKLAITECTVEVGSVNILASSACECWILVKSVHDPKCITTKAFLNCDGRARSSRLTVLIGGCLAMAFLRGWARRRRSLKYSSRLAGDGASGTALLLVFIPIPIQINYCD